MLPNVLPRNGADPTSPSSRTRCASSSPCGRARRSSTRRSARAVTRGLLARDLAGRASSSRSTAIPTAKPFFDRFKARRGSTPASCAATSRSSCRSSRRTVLWRMRCCSTSASRRCRSTGPSAGSRTRPTRRSTCAWTRPPSSPRADIVDDVGRARARLDLPTLRGGALRRAIARAIVRRRSDTPLTRTGELVDVIKTAIPTPARFGEGHPAKRVFQALRIAVNDELAALETALPAALADAPAGWSSRGDRLPLARGPHRQALSPGSGEGVHVSTRLPCVRVRQAAGVAALDTQGRAALRP